MSHSLVTILLLLLFITTYITAQQPSPVVLDTTFGSVRGFELENSWRFLGIPYAEPPVGSLRWQPPVLKRPWFPEIFDASKYGPICPQRNIEYGLVASEDCLTLNIYTPVNAVESKNNRNKRNRKVNKSLLPVMLYIHGGGYFMGTLV